MDNEVEVEFERTEVKVGEIKSFTHWFTLKTSRNALKDIFPALIDKDIDEAQKAQDNRGNVRRCGRFNWLKELSERAQ